MQTFNKFGRKIAVVAVIAITVAFGLWEASFVWVLPALSSVLGHELEGFPGTLMIISGWAPVVGWKVLSDRAKAGKVPIVSLPADSHTDPNLPVQ